MLLSGRIKRKPINNFIVNWLSFIVFFATWYIAIACQESFQYQESLNDKEILHNYFIKSLFYFLALIIFVTYAFIKTKRPLLYLSLDVFDLILFIKWLVILAVPLGVLKLGLFYFYFVDYFKLGSLSISVFFLRLFVTVVMAALFEEIAYCGLLFKLFEEQKRIRIGFFVIIILRMLTHNKDLFFFIYAVAGGIIITMSRLKTKSTVIPILLHATHNLYWMQYYSIDW